MKTIAIFSFLFIGCFTLSAQEFNHYYGNIHAHSGFSDGNKDSLYTEVSTPKGCFKFAKSSEHFDFWGYRNTIKLCV